MLFIITIVSTTTDNHESTLGTGTNDLENDTGAHRYLYSCQVERASGLSGNSIDTGNITANISGSNYDHESCVENESLFNCGTKESVDDETNSNCDTKEKVEDESVRLSGMNAISPDFVNHDHMYQPFCLENDFCDIDSVQDSTFVQILTNPKSSKRFGQFCQTD